MRNLWRKEGCYMSWLQLKVSWTPVEKKDIVNFYLS